MCAVMWGLYEDNSRKSVGYVVVISVKGHMAVM